MSNKQGGNAESAIRANHFLFLDNIHTTIFTPSEHQVELLDASKQNDIAVCLASSSSQMFIVVMLIKELAHRVRGRQPTARHSVIAVNSALALQQFLDTVRDHSDLKVAEVTSDDRDGLRRTVDDHNVIVIYVRDLVTALRDGLISLSAINVLVVDECHLALRCHPCRDLLRLMRGGGGKGTGTSVRILGLSASVLGQNCDPDVLEERILRLERSTGCTAETSSGLVLLSRYSAWPQETVVECADYIGGALDAEIRVVVSRAANFLQDHVYKPEDIYGTYDDDDEEEEEMPIVPDPTVAPMSFLEDLIYILEVMGPWCADRAAWFFMKELKKHKDKTPYERHYLLLSVVYTVMESVRAICDSRFRELSEKDRMQRYTSPKVLRLLEILRHYKPPVAAAEDSGATAATNGGGCGDQGEKAPSASDSVVGDQRKSNHCTGHRCACSAATCRDRILSGTCVGGDTARHCECTSKHFGVGVQVVNGKSDSNFGCDSSAGGPCDGGGRLLNGEAAGQLTVAICGMRSARERHGATAACRPNGRLSQAEYRRQRATYSRGPRWTRSGALSTVGGATGRATAYNEPNSLWGIVFVEKRYVACILNMFLKESSRQLADCAFVSPNFIMGQRQVLLSGGGTAGDAKEAQLEHRKQEEVLRRFRTHECNLLVATNVVEDGIDLPKCNLVVRFDPPRDYRSYTQSKGRAKAIPSRFVLLIEQARREAFLCDLGRFCATERILLSRCHGREVPVNEEVDLGVADALLPPYRPGGGDAPEVNATMSSAIAMVNRYCARLPSDTFTRLVPRCSVVRGADGTYVATLRLPINSPVKQPIMGPPMPNIAVAKMAAALNTVRVLHEYGELDDYLLPVGKMCTRKEAELASTAAFASRGGEGEGGEEEDEEVVEEGAPRPGTTKRRQYYNKRTALAFTRCLPVPGRPAHLYHISMKLTCPIPEEQNVRGRQIYEPASVAQGFGILTSTRIPEICGFPVFTRSGEVRVKLVPVASGLLLTQDELAKLYFFHWFTFTNVLRLEKYPMCYDLESAENSILVVPLNQTGPSPPDAAAAATTCHTLDWTFVDEIVLQRHAKPAAVPEGDRADFAFDEALYRDAVVMPWYRNLDQPQYFYVAEVCRHLSPRSDFPDDDFETFDNYYGKKYGIRIRNLEQPLLDVDHTSARLNLLTPRYVNRKGVALPTSSEETKRAKRENLQQKQILVPELCTIHKFSASLWRKAVCLPCILYRLNSLLLADELRVWVATEIGLGRVALPDDHGWPDLDFGWSLADVVKARKLAADDGGGGGAQKKKMAVAAQSEGIPLPAKAAVAYEGDVRKGRGSSAFSIGTWSNEMAYPASLPNDGALTLLPSDLVMVNGGGLFDGEELDEEMAGLMCESSCAGAKGGEGAAASEPKTVRYGSPSNFEDGGWDLDNELEFDVMDIPGFGFISAPGGGFNMEDLSRDLEAYEETYLQSPRDGGSSAATLGGSGVNVRRARRSQGRVYGGGNSDDSDDEDDVEDDVDEDDDDDSGGERYFWRDGTNQAAKHARDLVEGMRDVDGEKEWSSGFDWEAEAFDDDDKYIGSKFDVPSPVDLTSRFPEKICFVWSDETVTLQKPDGFRSLRKPGADATAQEHCSKPQSEICDNGVVGTEAVNLSKASVACYQSDSDVIAATMRAGICRAGTGSSFSFDHQPDLSAHPGPSPSVLLQALTMSNANDGINLERLETIGDSFLKHAITTYLYCAYPSVHEGKLSHLRSKQVSNLKLYRLGRRKGFAQFMIATKFEPNDNWLPPGYIVPKELEQALIDSGIPCGYWNIARLPRLGADLDAERIRRVLAEHGEELRKAAAAASEESRCCCKQQRDVDPSCEMSCFIPYNLMTQHSIPDKSIADCVEAQIGAYLTSCGPRGALLFMSWLGISVLPSEPRLDGRPGFGHLALPPSPLQAAAVPCDAEERLGALLSGYDAFEERIGYRFSDRSYLLQAFTHASYHYNRYTDCYQRLEFLGDAVLDYLITRHLYEDKRQHSPGTLTDLRSALVNNTIFATLAVRYDFHKYFKALCPNLFLVIDRFVRTQKENDHRISEDFYFMEEEECEEVEDIEVPKALGDVFESVAGAIYLDSGMSLDTVWTVYYGMMKSEIELFSTSVPKSPIRELLEREPETAKFGKPERTLDGKVRVTVEVFGKGHYTALGRNYRIAKCTAAKHALKALRKLQGALSAL